MASLIDPYCAVPMIHMPNEEIVERCTKISSYIGNIIFTIIGSIIIFFCVREIRRTKRDVETVEEDKLRKMWAWIGVGITSFIILFIWMLGVNLSVLGRVNQWKGYQYQIDHLMKEGNLTKGQAMHRIQNFEQARMQSKATMKAGNDISNAIMFNTLNKKW